MIVFELFSTNIDHPANYDSIPFSEQLSLSPPAMVQAVLEDEEGQPFRVDGFRGLRDNYGSLYGLMDMRGISPLWLHGPETLVYADYTDNPLAWELFAVKYVFSGKEKLSLPSQVIAMSAKIYLERYGCIVSRIRVPLRACITKRTWSTVTNGLWS